MGQFLRIALVLVGLWVILRIIRRALANRRSGTPSSPPPADMLRCDYCGMFVPRSDATTTSGKIYCSTKHADADRARN
jgi:uncharacterized protein